MAVPRIAAAMKAANSARLTSEDTDSTESGSSPVEPPEELRGTRGTPRNPRDPRNPATRALTAASGLAARLALARIDAGIEARGETFVVGILPRGFRRPAAKSGAVPMLINKAATMKRPI